MNKKKIKLLAASMMAGAIASVIAIGSLNASGNWVDTVNAATTYTLTLNKTTNKVYTGNDVIYDSDVYVKTSLDNDIQLNVDGISDPSTSYWQKIAAGGSITFKTKVSGIKSIQVYATQENSYTIYRNYITSEDPELNFVEGSKITTKTAISSTGSFYTFSDPYPNYLKLVFAKETKIYSIKVNYCCSEAENPLSTLKWSSDNTSYGTVAKCTPVLMAEGESRLLYAKPEYGYKLTGWYDGNDLVSTDSTFRYTMPDNGAEHNVVAKFEKMTSSEKTALDLKLGVTVAYDSKWGMYYYGFYPQDLAASSSKNTDLFNLLEPIYKEGNVSFSIQDPAFYNGEYYVRNNGKYFLMERIECYQIGYTSTKTKLCTRKIITGGSNYQFNSSTAQKARTPWGETGSAIVYANNYKYSDLRRTLNTTLVDEMFHFSRSNLTTSTVDNSAASMGRTSNEYACENTTDYIYLPSYYDVAEGINVFGTEKEITDYAISLDVDYTSNNNCGYFWTRSPYYNQDSYAYNVSFYGNIERVEVNSTTKGIIPLFTVLYNR